LRKRLILPAYHTPAFRAHQHAGGSFDNAHGRVEGIGGDAGRAGIGTTAIPNPIILLTLLPVPASGRFP
jgi:hypothetical protein